MDKNENPEESNAKLIEDLNNQKFITLLDMLSYYTLIANDSEVDLNSNLFVNLGNFYSKENKSGFRKQYQALIRRFPIKGKEYIIDLVIKDTTKIFQVERLSIENNLKQKVFSKLAHEFKTPMIIVSNEVKELVNELHTNMRVLYKDKCDMLINISEYCLFLIDDIIQYSTNFSNLKINTEEDVNLEEIIIFAYNVMKSFKEYMPGGKNKPVNCEYFYDTNINNYKITTDKVRLKQVLLNFISNSVKFTKNGTICLRCELSHDCNQISLSIYDTGIGISQEDLEKINKKMGCDTIKINLEKGYNQMGTGIGLGISKAILDLLPNHGMNIDSVLGQGTTVNIIIKSMEVRNFYLDNEEIKSFDLSSRNNTMIISKKSLHEDSDITISFINRSPYRSPLPNINKIPIRKQSKSFSITNYNFLISPYDLKVEKDKIIIIDDSEPLRKSIRNMVKSYNKIQNIFDIVEGDDGIDLLNYLKTNQNAFFKISIVFMDENMEYLNGNETIKIIRKLEKENKFKKTKIVSVTAFSDDQNTEQISKAGADMVITKPIKKDTLFSILDEVRINK